MVFFLSQSREQKERLLGGAKDAWLRQVPLLRLLPQTESPYSREAFAIAQRFVGYTYIVREYRARE
jgi:hypothetical protein